MHVDGQTKHAYSMAIYEELCLVIWLILSGQSTDGLERLLDEKIMVFLYGSLVPCILTNHLAASIKYLV